MKVKKSMFAKLLALALPMAAISVVTPIVLTSCGSSTSETNKTQASWDTTKTQEGLTFNTANNSAVITLGSNKFDNTNISSSSKFDDIKKSLDPSVSGSTLYSVLSGAIKDVGNYDVKLLVDTNPIVFDYSNNAIGNYFNGQFQLTPKSGTNVTAVNLNFRVNNFNDSYNGASGKDLQWDVSAIESALKSGGSIGNNLPEVTPKDNGSYVTINLSNQNGPIGLGKVMDELCEYKSKITPTQLEKFIKNYSTDSNFDLSKATISSWAPTIDGTAVFTRIVAPSKTGGQDAILYIAYTGFKKDDGNVQWNRNIAYPDSVNGSLNNTWDSKWHEPIIDLSKISENVGDTDISKNSTYNDITSKDKITPFVEYMVKNYIMKSDNFDLCFSGIKDTATNKNTIVHGTFDKNWLFTSDATSGQTQAKSLTKTDDSNSESIKAVQIKVFLTPKKDTSTSATPSYGNGIWRSFYIINYSGGYTGPTTSSL